MSLPKSFRQTIGLQPSQVNVFNAALLVVDAQKEYAPGGGLAVSNYDSSRKVIIDVIEKFRSAGGEVIHIQHSTAPGAPVFDPTGDKFQEFDGITLKENEKSIIKHAPSSFTGTDLHEYLQQKGKKQIVLVGYMAHVCITGTARSGFELGYDVVVVKDGIGDRDIPSYDGKSTVKGEFTTEVVLHELADAIASVVESKDIEA